jgi:hypothetical protein
MIGLKRLIPPGLVISAGAHVGVLVLGLFFVSASAIQSQQPAATPTEAVLVDLVQPKEAPRLEGTPSDAATSGSKKASNSENPRSAQPQPPQPNPQPPQQPQQRASQQHDTRQAAAPAQSQMPLPQAPQSETAQPEKTQPQTKTVQQPQPEPAPQPTQPQSQPNPEEKPERPGASERFAALALLGGRLGGGFEAPAVDAPSIGHDFTVAFRERVSSCSALPAGINSNEQIRVSVLVFFKPDGTLAAAPQVSGNIASQKEQALAQSAVQALEKCQPYSMLPKDKYDEWRTLDLIFSPMNFSGR